MNGDFISAIQRREFLKLFGATAALVPSNSVASPAARKVVIVTDPSDPVASSGPGKWAAGQLRQALAGKGTTCEIVETPTRAKGSDFCVIVAGPASSLSKSFPTERAGLTEPESLRIAPGHLGSVAATLVSGSDPRGLVYGVLELAERVQFSTDPVAALQTASVVEEKPANQVRSVARAFCSEIEDKSWYYDKDFWRGYLDVLAKSRFNRFNFALGFGYDFPRGVTGDYFHFPYPYLLEVPGYDVRVVCLSRATGAPSPLSAAERDRNFEMLRFIAAETALRGLQFQLGLWTHAYQWTDSPHADHRIEGLTPETHAPYCRDALAL